MTDDTTRTLSLPYLQPGQALKTITHNEALQRLDAGLYLSISNMAAAELRAHHRGKPKRRAYRTRRAHCSFCRGRLDMVRAKPGLDYLG